MAICSQEDSLQPRIRELQKLKKFKTASSESPRLDAFSLDPCGQRFSIILIAKHNLDQVGNRKLKGYLITLIFSALFPLCPCILPNQWLRIECCLNAAGARVRFPLPAAKEECHLKQPSALPFPPPPPYFSLWKPKSCRLKTDNIWQSVNGHDVPTLDVKIWTKLELGSFKFSGNLYIPPGKVIYLYFCQLNG